MSSESIFDFPTTGVYAGLQLINQLNSAFAAAITNSAGTEPPTAPITDQFWYNPDSSVLSVYNGAEWVPTTFGAAFSSVQLISGATTVGYPQLGAVLEAQGSSGYTITLPAPSDFVGANVAVFNNINSSSVVTVATPAGSITGIGAGAAEVTLPFINWGLFTSDGYNWLMLSNVGYALVGGSASQTFDVGAATGPNNAIPLSQAQDTFAGINGNSSEPFAVGDATNAQDAVNLGQADASYATLASNNFSGSQTIAQNLTISGTTNAQSGTFTALSANSGAFNTLNGNNITGTFNGTLGNSVVLPSGSSSFSNLTVLDTAAIGNLTVSGATSLGVTTIPDATANDNPVALGQLASGASVIEYTQGASGSVAETLQARLQVSVSVLDFGADPTGTNDSSTAFQDAADSGASRIVVPSGTYLIDTAPTVTTSVFWDIVPSAVFTGSATGVVKGWPAMATNGSQIAVGPWVQSRSTTSGITGGGTAALNVEALPPSSVVNNVVGAYIGCGGAPTSSGSVLFAMNTNVSLDSGAGGAAIGYECDVNNFAGSNIARGIYVTGAGTYANETGVRVDMHSGSPNWATGLLALDCDVGVNVGGITPVTTQTAAALGQPANDSDTILIQQNASSSPTGWALRIVNADQTATVGYIDINANIYSPEGTLSIHNASYTGAVLGAESINATTTAGDITIDAAEMIAGIFVDSATQSGNFTFTTDTAANIIAALPGVPSVNQSFRFRFINNDQSSTAYDGTLVGGAGVTIQTTTTSVAISKLVWADYLVQITDITSGSEAVQLTLIGAGSI